MKKWALLLLAVALALPLARAEEGDDDFVIEKEYVEESAWDFIGYYFMKYTRSNIAPTNDFLKGQVVGRLFGGNTTRTSDELSAYSEQRFMPMITYSPRLFDGWAKMRMSFEFDWTHGDVNYTTGGNFGGAFGADVVNMQTQNLFLELRPQKNLIFNAGLMRLYDNVRVPYYTPIGHLVNKGYRLALFGSDASGANVHWSPKHHIHLKAGGYQLYENNVEQDDDVQLYEFMSEYDLDIINTVGFNLYYLRDRASGEGGVSILGQGLSSSLAGYNGVADFKLGASSYTADIFWPGLTFHGNALLDQGRFGYNGFVYSTLGRVDAGARNIDVMGLAGNVRLAWKYGRTTNDKLSLDAIYTTGDDDIAADNTYNGVLTGNNWSAPGAVFFSHGLYLLLPHGNVVNRYVAAVVDMQNMGYGFAGGSATAAFDVIPNRFNVKAGLGLGMANADPSYTFTDDNNVTHSFTGGRLIGTEVNLNLRYTLRVFMDLELHAAYMMLGDFYETPATNGWKTSQPLGQATVVPDDPWTVFATLKWIMF